MLSRFLCSFLIGLLGLALIASCTGFVAMAVPPNDNLIVHEWGTFTSVADEEGTPIRWFPLSGSSDLPCFVHRLGGGNIKSGGATVRMETPVLYFYTPRPVSVSVSVSFPQGLITEWYPQASKVEPNLSSPRAGVLTGRIEWASVDVCPDSRPELPMEKGASHYYAARETDADVLFVGAEQEKLIFYRGLGEFPVPLRPRLVGDNGVELRNIGRDPIAEVILFENRGGKFGYRRISKLSNQVTLQMPEVTGNLASVTRELEEILIAQGLYPKEARAMLKTWRDSWFEEGTRLFYIVPPRTVDSGLPLTIHPGPSSTVRVFVGRVEVLTPWTEKVIEQALLADDIKTLGKYLRFLQPWTSRVVQGLGDRMNSERVMEVLNSAYSRIQAESNSRDCSK